MQSIIYEQRHKLFSGLFETISDRSKAVRLSAAEALTEALKLVAQRESTVENIGQALHHIHINIGTTVNERVIGSFLILEILLSGAVMTSTEFQSAFKSSTILGNDELLWGVLQKKEHADSEIKTKVIELIPKLAFVFSADFKQGIRALNNSLTYLVYSIDHLLVSVRTVEYRKVAYISIGKLFQAMSMTFKASTAKISEIMGAVKRGFGSPFCIEALQCLGMVLTVSEGSREYLDREMLRAMFNGGFTSDLAQCLKIVLIHKPEERRSIQYDLILPHFEEILATEAEQKLAAEENVVSASAVKSQSFFKDVLSNTIALVTSQNPKKVGTSMNKESTALVLQHVPSVSVSFESQIILGLQMLASSDFFPIMSRQDSERNREESSRLLEIIRNSVMRYLNHEKPDIRRAVVVTTISMLDKVILSVDSKSSDSSLVGTIVDRILVHGIGDDDPSIRASVFESLMPSLDLIVSHSRNVNCVIEAINDDFITVRCASMSLLARISSFNKIHLLPIIRLLLSKLMRQLQMSADKQLHQESVLLVQAIVKGSTTQMLPFVENIFKAMLTLLDAEGESSDPRAQAVVAASLATIGELVVSSPELITSNQDKIFKMIVSALEDTSNAAKKQEMAVITLGKIVRSSGMKDLPYARYPGLFESIVGIIQRNDDIPLRLQAVKTAGLLGVAEQNIFEGYLFNVGIVDKDRDGEDMLDILGNVDDENEDEEMKLDKLYLSVIIKSLTKIISDDNLHKFHQDAAQVIVEIIKTLKRHIMEDRVCMGDIIRSFHDRIKKSDLNPAVRKILIEQLTTIVHVIGKYLGEYRGEYLADIIGLVQEFFFSDQHDCLNLVESLCLEVKKQDEVDLILSNIVPCMIRTIKEEPITFLEDIQSRRTSVGARPSLPKSEDVFKVVANISSRLGQYRVQFLPHIVQIMCRKDIALESRRRALCTVVHIALDSNESAIGVVHPILRLLSDQCESDLYFPVVAGLLSLAVKLRDLFKPFIVPIKRKLEQIKKKGVLLRTEYQDQMAQLLLIYNSVIDQICKGEAIDCTHVEFSFDRTFPRDLKRYKDLKVSSKPEKMSLEVKKGDLGLAWTLTGRMTASDLSQWMDRLSKELLQQSPSSILRLCSNLAQKSRSLANELFNISFSAIWDHLLISDASDLNNLILNLELALRSPQIPVSITHTILNLAEFMEILGKSFSLDIELLARDSEEVEMYSKCLYFREIEFSSLHLTPTQVEECIASLITVNNKLGLLDSASGILKCVENRYRDSFEVKPYWLEMLTRWELADQAYKNKLSKYEEEKLDPWKEKGRMECELGRFRCLHALGAYDDLLLKAEELKQRMEVNSEEVENYHYWIDEIEKLGASAAWNLNKCTDMERFMSTDTGMSSSATAVDVNLEQNKSFFQAISAIKRKKYPDALKIIDSTRKSISSNIGILLGENYSRANKAMVSMQVLAEMEEAIEYNIKKDNLERAILKISDFYDEDIEDHATPVDKKKHDITTKKNHLKQKLLKTWNMRFVNLPKDIDTYRLVLSVHSLVVEDPEEERGRALVEEDLYHWLKLASMCRKEGRLLLCESILLRLGGPAGKSIIEDILKIRTDALEELAVEKLHDIPLYILYDTCKLLWTIGRREEAVQELRGIVDYIDELQKKNTDKRETGRVIKVKALLKRAEWMKTLRQPPEEVFEVVKIAKDTTLKTGNYWIWHAWGTVNFEKVQAAVAVNKVKEQVVNKQEVRGYLLAAVDGFLKSVQYGDEDRQPLANILPDVLRLIELFFNIAPQLYAPQLYAPQYVDVLKSKVSTKYWIELIPQLIARMDNDPRQILKFILDKLAYEHPQAIVCPILLAKAMLDDETSKKVRSRKDDITSIMVNGILDVVRKTEDGETLIQEAQTMSRELKKVAMTPQEFWLEGLEKIKKVYGEVQKSYAYPELIKELEQLHASMGDTIKHESLRDISFIHCFGGDISEAYRWLMIFKDTHSLFDLRQAWEIYLKLNRKLRDQIKCMEKIELGHISQGLARYRFSKLAVPGTYRDQKVIKILQFIGTVDVFQSKQRPRKISILGSDAKTYSFCLFDAKVCTIIDFF
jgi:serine/threonine-protein kinase mTOR